MSERSDKLTVHGVSHVLDVCRQAPGLVDEVLVEVGLSGGEGGQLSALLKEGAFNWRPAERGELVRAAGGRARRAVAILRPYPYLSLPQLLAEGTGRSLVVALDSITDPGNLGAIIRNAVFFGALGIITTKDRSAEVTAAVVRRSAGAAAVVRIAKVTNLARALRELKGAGYWVYGTVPGQGALPSAEAFPERTCFVLGSEGKGLRPVVAKECDGSLSVAGDWESLNVASFAAVLLYEWAREG